MKKQLTLLLLLCAMIGQAQDKARFGIKGGLNISTITVSGVNVDGKICTKPGFHVGGLVAFPVTSKFRIQPEMLYSNQGYRYKLSSVNARLDAKANLDYLAIPVMFCYYPIKNLDVEIGPQFSFLMKHKTETEYRIVDINGDVQYGTVTVDNMDDSQSFEVGLNVGLAYKLGKDFFVSGRYNFGLSTVNKKYESGPNEDEKDRNSVFQFSVGYMFH